jgi:PTH1 family peptidyl-tRNA hydrolase
VEWLIVGLGNPGAEYKGTRHNVCFDVIEHLASRHRIKVDRGRQRAMVGVGQVEGVPCALAKPLTFMNLSGQSVAPLMRHFNVKPARVLVIADDLDLPVGKIRLREKGGSGGHNGHKSLAQGLGTQDYPRIRVGIGNTEDPTIEHVLSRFTPEERVDIDRAIRIVSEVVEMVVSGQWEEALVKVASENKD